MDKNEFKSFCKNEFETRGFKKIKKSFYLPGKDLLCGIDLQKSNYSNSYYINFYFFLNEFNNINEYPTSYEFDIHSRILAMSKTQTIRGKHFMTSQIEYEEYTEEELRQYFNKELEERILPPIHQGKKYILDNLGKLYTLSLRKDEVMRKLQSDNNTGDGSLC